MAIYEVSKVVIYSGKPATTDIRYAINAEDTTLEGEGSNKQRFDTFKAAVLSKYNQGDIVVNRPGENINYEDDVVVHRRPVDEGAMRQIGLGILEKMLE